MKYSARLFEPVQAHKALQTAWERIKPEVLAGNRLVLEVRSETRSSQLNRFLHAIIGEVAAQAEWMGKPRKPEEWKVLFVSGHAMATKQGGEVVPGIEGEFVSIRESTASMSNARASSLVEYILAWCAANNITISEAWDVEPQ